MSKVPWPLFLPTILFVCTAGLGAILATVSVLLVARRGARWCWVRRMGFFGCVAGGSVMAVSVYAIYQTGFSLTFPSREPVVSGMETSSPLNALLSRHAESAFSNGRAVGLVVGIVRGDDQALVEYGRAALDSRKAVTGDTLFEIGSITKVFTALALASEIERGRISLDKHLQDLLPRDVDLPWPARKVSLREIVTHTSGFPRGPGNLKLSGTLGRMFWGANPYRDYGQPELDEAVRRLKLISLPGEASVYSNFAMAVLGNALARSLGGDFERLIQQNICKPLGLKNTTSRPSANQRSHLAQGYRAILAAGPAMLALRSDRWDGSALLDGAGSLCSTGNDMMTFLRANMHPDETPIAGALRRTHVQLFEESKNSAYGMNWVRTRFKWSKTTVIWHNGATGGFSAFIGFLEDGSVGVFVLSNSAGNADALGLQLLRSAVTQRESFLLRGGHGHRSAHLATWLERPPGGETGPLAGLFLLSGNRPRAR